VGRFPSHFTPSPKPVEPGGDDARLVQVLDLVGIGDQLVRDQQLAVGVDASGRLALASPGSIDQFFEAAHQQLVLHQVATRTGARHLAVDQLWLFDLQVMEQVSDASTLNDPVFLYGTLYGPARGPTTLTATQGQLAVTRGDLLEAFVRASPFGGARPGGAPSDKSVGLLLPAEVDGPLQHGEGFVLAHPVPPPELADTGGNGAQVRQLIHQLLTELQRDLDGRKRSTLSKLFVAGPKVEVPLHASHDQLLEAARRARSLLDGWPAPRVASLFDRVGPARAASSHSAVVTASPVRLPTAPARVAKARDDDWMKDFVNAHVAQGSPPVKVTVTTPPSGRPGWMSDFDAPVESTPSENRPRPAQSGEAKPDWMKDFGD
jgi:hypothetical protein